MSISEQVYQARLDAYRQFAEAYAEYEHAYQRNGDVEKAAFHLWSRTRYLTAFVPKVVANIVFPLHWNSLRPDGLIEIWAFGQKVAAFLNLDTK